MAPGHQASLCWDISIQINLARIRIRRFCVRNPKLFFNRPIVILGNVLVVTSDKRMYVSPNNLLIHQFVAHYSWAARHNCLQSVKCGGSDLYTYTLTHLYKLHSTPLPPCERCSGVGPGTAVARPNLPSRPHHGATVRRITHRSLSRSSPPILSPLSYHVGN